MSTCQVLARWPAAQPAEQWVPRPDLKEQFQELAAGPTWLPEVPVFDSETDSETDAAMTAWRHEGLDLMLDERGISWPERVPFRVDHLGEVLAEFQVDRRGEWFEALGELDEAVAARLAGLRHVSPHVRYDRARVIDNASLRFVKVTASTLVELSAVDTPGLPDTTLMVGNPGSRWVPESTVARFRQMEEPGTVRLAFPGKEEQPMNAPTATQTHVVSLRRSVDDTEAQLLVDGEAVAGDTPVTMTARDIASLAREAMDAGVRGAMAYLAEARYATVDQPPLAKFTQIVYDAAGEVVGSWEIPVPGPRRSDLTRRNQQ